MLLVLLYGVDVDVAEGTNLSPYRRKLCDKLLLGGRRTHKADLGIGELVFLEELCRQAVILLCAVFKHGFTASKLSEAGLLITDIILFVGAQLIRRGFAFVCLGNPTDKLSLLIGYLFLKYLYLIVSALYRLLHIFKPAENLISLGFKASDSLPFIAKP